MNKINNLVKDICESEIYVSNNEEYVIIPKEISKSILSDRRKKIIDLLREQNPINESKLDFLFNADVHSDLIILNHFGIINIQKIDSNSKHNIITLNRNVRIIEAESN